MSVKAKWLLSEVKATAELTISKAGQKLLPFVIFFGKQTARAKHYNKMRTNPDLYPQVDIKCMVSKKARMDTMLMHEWIDSVWQPYTELIDGLMYLIIDKCPSHEVSFT